jgi:PPK2 family polyphosphate:nucleotide phosphotransferase
MALDLSTYRIQPGTRFRLADRSTSETAGLAKDRAKDAFKDNIEALDSLQERLFAEGKQSLLVVLQAMDGGGKDSTIRSVFGPLNALGVTVHGFKKPTELELAHDFLWRVHPHAPGKGAIAVFNRSHYEDVLVVRVHGYAEPDVIEARYGHIQAFERLVAERGTRVVKFLLHVSKEYQLDRMRRRLENPDKHWKFNPDDLEERKLWDQYMEAFEIAISRTTTDDAPWYVVPSEERWFRDVVVSGVVRETLERMNPQYPPPSFNPADYPPETLR